PSSAGMLVVIDEGIVDDDLSTLGVEGESHFLHALALHRGAYRILASRLRVEQKKPSPTGSGNFASQNSGIARHTVEVIDARAGNTGRYVFFGPPGVVEKMAKVFQVAA